MSLNSSRPAKSLLQPLNVFQLTIIVMLAASAVYTAAVADNDVSMIRTAIFFLVCSLPIGLFMCGDWLFQAVHEEFLKLDHDRVYESESCKTDKRSGNTYRNIRACPDDVSISVRVGTTHGDVETACIYFMDVQRGVQFARSVKPGSHGLMLSIGPIDEYPEDEVKFKTRIRFIVFWRIYRILRKMNFSADE